MTWRGTSQPLGHAARVLTDAELRELRAFCGQFSNRESAASACGTSKLTLDTAIRGGRVRADTAKRILEGVRKKMSPSPSSPPPAKEATG
jgi:hypothetical protein